MKKNKNFDAKEYYKVIKYTVNVPFSAALKKAPLSNKDHTKTLSILISATRFYSDRECDNDEETDLMSSICSYFSLKMLKINAETRKCMIKIFIGGGGGKGGGWGGGSSERC